MASIEFVRTSVENFYLSDAGTGNGPAVAYAVAFPPDGMPERISLADSWSIYNGAYVFTAGPIGDVGAFAGAVLTWLRDGSRRGVRFAWFADAASGATAVGLRTVERGGLQCVERPATFALRALTLIVAGGSAITLDADANRFRFTPPAGIASSMRLLGSWGSRDLSDALGALLYLPLAGAASGCLRFDMSVAESHLDAGGLDAALRYFVPGVAYPGYDYLESFRYPVLAPAEALHLGATIDPLALLAPARSYLSFSENADGSQAVTSVLGSCLRTNTGQRVALTPGADARFVFELNPGTLAGSVRDPGYLAPAGAFTITLPMQQSSMQAFSNRIMCGAAGVEYLALPGTAGSVLHFIPRQAAYAAGFTIDASGSSDEAALDAPLLTAQATTSWAYVTPPAGQSVYYYAQPEGSAFYAAQQGDDHFLHFAEIPGERLPPEIGAPSDAPAATPDVPGAAPFAAFPMVPYAGLSGDEFDRIHAFERRVLSKSRRDAIAALAASLGPRDRGKPGDPVLTVVTPQGMMATFNATTGFWRSLTILESDGGASNLQLTNITGALRAALQTNQLFLVISSGDALLRYCSVNYLLTSDALDGLKGTIDDAIIAKLRASSGIIGVTFATIDDYTAALLTALTAAEHAAAKSALQQAAGRASIVIADWTFDLSPYLWEEHGTILIFKFHDRPLADLAGDLSAWTQATVFNTDARAVQRDLAAIIADARDRYEGQGDTDFSHFVRNVVDSAGFNGVLALRVPIPLATMPPQLEGIAAGIDASRFYVHHLGASITPVTLAGGTVELDDSALFGLIHYNDPDDLFGTGVDYGFKVLSLKVLFRNSAVANFSSQAELMINRLFGERVTLAGGEHGNNLLLNGVYQRQGDYDSYVFTGQGVNAYRAASHVLAGVVVTRTQFVTQGNAGAGRGVVMTRFLLQGNLAFKRMGDFDLFSFGPEPAAALDASAGLAFSNLVIAMQFDRAAPAKRTFTFDAGTLSFDPSNGGARSTSLFRRFPLKLMRLVQASGTSTPGDRGYMPVDTPLAASDLGTTWYGLEFNLNLGTTGALAAKAGLVATLIAAWSPNESDASIFTGIRLPGSTGGGREIPLQGILKLTIDSVEFHVANAREYILMFRNIALGFLVFSFPPDGQTNVVLFGDPAGADNTTVGWYAAYAKSAEEQS